MRERLRSRAAESVPISSDAGSFRAVKTSPERSLFSFAVNYFVSLLGQPKGSGSTETTAPIPFPEQQTNGWFDRRVDAGQVKRFEARTVCLCKLLHGNGLFPFGAIVHVRAT